MKNYLIEFSTKDGNISSVYVDAYSETDALDYFECNYEFVTIIEITEVFE